jgi:hypothetical protein
MPIEREKSFVASSKPSLAFSATNRQRQASIAFEDNVDVILEGRFFKQGEGNLLGSKNWKERHFELSRTTLSYFDKKVSAVSARLFLSARS